MRRLTVRTLVATAAAACAAVLVPPDPGAIALGEPADPRDESLDFRFPAADMVRVPDTNTYVAYGASSNGRLLPYTKVQYDGGAFQRRGAIDGDAWDDATFPAGYWAEEDSKLWTPSMFAHREDDGNGEERTVYYLFYSAHKAGTVEKHCIGYATSLSYTGGFVAKANPLFCPGPADSGPWAIDADVSRGDDGIWMTLRNGAWTENRITALGASRLDFDAIRHVRLDSPPVKLLDNAGLEWTWENSPGEDVKTIENPSAVAMGGQWYLFYSGNNWYANRYSTGVAYCGTSLLDNRCTPMYEQRAYFSYEPDPNGEPRFRPGLPAEFRKRNLPGNKRGPGAFDVVKDPDGNWWATWNYITDDSVHQDPSPIRQSRLGRLTRTGTGSTAEFAVAW